MDACLFCQIIAKKIPAAIIYEDNELLAFHDIAPQAPVHVLIIPKEHIATLNDLKPSHTELMGKMISGAQKIAEKLGIDEKGYRLTMNCNRQGGQSVFHIHLHLLGGRQMHWPPG
ncbi:histidine triad nucleotide-binding protein [candidate division KSB1 bacterium]|nr:histidine triad nucleotide-binding protein [candidate division KSB1 bacterium]